MSLLLALSLLMLPGSVAPCEALGLPGRSPRLAGDSDLPLAASAPAGLQEVAPPLAVQQLQQALAGREPHVEILAPAHDTLLPPGPWTLQLRVHDWPLVDGGALGLGPHLVVQLDDEAPLRLTGTEITLPGLAPGSHRLTVFAARPWGEAAKNPGAWSQIRLHRAATNPLAVPPPGQAQLIAVSPAATAAAEPLLLDWLLLDAPLQNLRSDDGRWRLRVTINGDGFVIARQTPLWLKGWKPGRNAIRLELLDGRGDALNPPYNSLVREVELSRTTRKARWQQGPLSAGELAILLGEAPAEAVQDATETEAAAQISLETGSAARPGAPSPASAAAPASDVRAEAAAPATTTRRDAEQVGGPDQAAERDAPGPADQTAPPSNPPRLEGSALSAESAQPGRLSRSLPSPAEPSRSPDAAASPAMADRAALGPLPPQSDPGPAPDPQGPGSLESEAATGIPADQPAAMAPRSATPATATPSLRTGESAAGQEAAANPAPRPGSLPAPSPSPQPTALSRPPAAPEATSSANLRLQPSSSLSGSAREQVNPDGTMLSPPRRGPLAGLRERLLP
ncbi:MAG: hypothetical protein WAM11_16795 [Cyanobium sp.]